MGFAEALTIALTNATASSSMQIVMESGMCVTLHRDVAVAANRNVNNNV